ncbi:putative low-complexity protein [Leptolyngbya sp. PCC 7375]|nr:putative low-complexity protein [Leptolyngbya sp. PCC 7375]
MNSDAGLPIRKPISIWKRPIEVKLGALVKAFGKGVIDGAFGNWQGLAQSSVDTLDALGLKTLDAGAIAWMLVQRSLLQAMSDLTKEYQKFPNPEPDFKMLYEQIDLVLEQNELSLDFNLFKKPKELDVVKIAKEPYQNWLCIQGLSKKEAEVIADRLPRYFVFVLHEQWRSHPKEYALLEGALDTPFNKATERELSWIHYSAQLQKRVDESMFYEAFSLRQIYIPLRAYYERKISDQDKERVVVDLEEMLINWITKGNRDDTIRVISGGPGCGKSSFCRMFAARLVEQEHIPLLFIPLYQLDLKGDLVDAITDFTQKNNLGNFPPNPLNSENSLKRLLLIFDGLDELTMQGEIATQVTQNFIQELYRKLLSFNTSEAKVLALISGRELVIQANSSWFRREGQTLYVLPYFQTHQEATKYQYIDPQKLLKVDQRHIWWKTYAELKKLDYEGLPQDLNKESLIEITAQPLLNYLVALSYEQGSLDFSKTSNLNAIYADLLKRVYQRDWEPYNHPTLGNIDEDNFVRILEEIAIACWHGNGRTSTASEIKKRCVSNNLRQIIDIFQKNVQEGVTRLLTAFYFHQNSIQGSEPTFEFTHKSFGEYLTIRRIVRELRLIQKQLNQHREEQDIGWDEKECLRRWVVLCGAVSIDKYSLKFLRDEIHLQDKKDVCQWQETLSDLIRFMLWHGMPMERLDPRPTYLEETKQSRNAEEALLAALSCCSHYTEMLSKIKWPTPMIFMAWITKLQGQKTGAGRPIALHCLNNLDLSTCILDFCDLRGANLHRSSLEEASLDGANLHGSTLEQASLVGASLYRVRLDGAQLIGAKLNGAKLIGANLDGVNLDEATLDGTDLSGAIVVNVSLSRSNIRNISSDFKTVVRNLKGYDTAQISQESRQQLNISLKLN